jgi:hypothetical protein
VRILPKILAAIVLLAWPGASGWAQQNFESFKLVRSRNIFDPDRRPPPSQNGAAASAVPIVQSDYVALTGTLLTSDKALAFFSGSRADFNQVLPVKSKIAGVTITKITVDNITIDRAGKTATVPVGWTVPLNGSAPAPAPVPDALPAPAAFGAAPAPAAPAAAAKTIPGPGPAVAGATARPAVPVATPNPDVARMMRERRLQEVK